MPTGGVRHRKPTNLKVLQGTARPERMPENEPRPAPIAPRMPLGLEPTARRTWRRLSPILEKVGLLTVADREQFAALCQAWARYDVASARLRRTLELEAAGQEAREVWGPVEQHEMAGRIRTAEVSVERAELCFRLLANEFGLSPAARSRLNVQPPASEEAFEEYLQRGRPSNAAR